MKKQKKKSSISLVITPAPVVVETVQPSSQLLEASLAARIADQLGETKHWPRKQIKRIVWALGDEQVRQLAQRALEIEDAGGMLIASGKRRRTLGGIFFMLAYSEGKPREGCELIRPAWQPRKKKVIEQVETVH